MRSDIYREHRRYNGSNAVSKILKIGCYANEGDDHHDDDQVCYDATTLALHPDEHLRPTFVL